MNRKCLVGAMALMAMTQTTIFANPSVDFIVREYSTEPSWIEVHCYLYTDLSGYIIQTTTSEAIINAGVFGESDCCALLDQSNTSGFTLNVEGDSIIFRNGDIWFSSIGYGNKGCRAVPPLPSESAVTPLNGGDDFNFCANPTPGEVGSWEPPSCIWSLTRVIINEVALHNTWGRCSNFIELYNTEEVAKDISGYQIICNSRYTVPDGTILQGNKRFVLDECDFPEGFVPNSDVDNIYLLREDSCLVDQVGWSSNHGENVSFMRFPDGNARWGHFADFSGYDDESSITFMNGFPSRRAFNRPESPGLSIIGLTAEIRDGLVDLYWTDPIWLTTFQASILRKSYEGFPMSPFDGELIYEGTDQKYLGDVVPENQTAYYTVFARTGCGEYSLPDSESQVAIRNGSVSADDPAQLPEKSLILSSYPNPFNAETIIEFGIPDDGYVELFIYDLIGRKIGTLVDGYSPKGEFKINWDASEYSSGIYLARMHTAKISKMSKLILLK